MSERPGFLPAPGVPGPERALSDVPEASSYQASDQVWIYRGRSWVPGSIVQVAGLELLVRYQDPDRARVVTDTVPAANVAARVTRPREP